MDCCSWSFVRHQRRRDFSGNWFESLESLESALGVFFKQTFVFFSRNSPKICNIFSSQLDWRVVVFLMTRVCIVHHLFLTGIAREWFSLVKACDGLWILKSVSVDLYTRSSELAAQNASLVRPVTAPFIASAHYCSGDRKRQSVSSFEILRRKDLGPKVFGFLRQTQITRWLFGGGNSNIIWLFSRHKTGEMIQFYPIHWVEFSQKGPRRWWSFWRQPRQRPWQVWVDCQEGSWWLVASSTTGGPCGKLSLSVFEVKVFI